MGQFEDAYRAMDREYQERKHLEQQAAALLAIIKDYYMLNGSWPSVRQLLEELQGRP